MSDNTIEIIEIRDDNLTKIIEIENDYNINPQALIPQPLIYPRVGLKHRKELDVYNTMLELANLHAESLQNQKFYDVNVSFENNQEKEREEEMKDKIIQKVPSYNAEVYLKYNSEENYYQIKGNSKLDEKDILLKFLQVLTKIMIINETNKQTNKQKKK